MYDERYANQWILNHESRKDVFRVNCIEPFVKKKIQQISDDARILDIGCGWGMVVDFIGNNQRYVGIDPTKEFFPYIKRKFPENNLTLIEGRLPHEINIDDTFDFISCLMALHCVENLKDSLKVIFDKVRRGGKVFVLDFSDFAEERLRKETYDPIYEEDKNHIKGVARLPSGIEVMSETFFHKELDFEKELDKYGKFEKEYLGSLFVSYEIIKQ